MNKYQQCTYCIMDNATDRTIKFDKNGRCNYCLDVEKRLKTSYFPNEEGKRKLESIIKKIKDDCKDDKYDCIVGISGGIDSSYILYLGHKYGLRMLGLHILDGLDNPVATENIRKLVEKTGIEYVEIVPDKEEYADILYSMFKASVTTLANAQDNLIAKMVHDYCKQNNIKYSLDGSNMAHESILERGNRIDYNDDKYILGIQKRFGTKTISKLKFENLWGRYLKRRREVSVTHVRPLNYVDYDFNKIIKELEEFCGFEYYGGKHYESILCRFMQCYYLPVKFGIDKRKSHYSSLILSGQMTREEALGKMKNDLYPSKELLEEDKKYLADYMGISVEELERCINLPPVNERTYPHSFLNELAPIARKLRKILE